MSQVNAHTFCAGEAANQIACTESAESHRKCHNSTLGPTIGFLCEPKIFTSLNHRFVTCVALTGNSPSFSQRYFKGELTLDPVAADPQDTGLRTVFPFRERRQSSRIFSNQITPILRSFFCVCACIYVCERDTERERDTHRQRERINALLCGDEGFENVNNCALQAEHPVRRKERLGPSVKHGKD